MDKYKTFKFENLGEIVDTFESVKSLEYEYNNEQAKIYSNLALKAIKYSEKLLSEANIMTELALEYTTKATNLNTNTTTEDKINTEVKTHD